MPTGPVPPTVWGDDAVCRTEDPDLFFPVGEVETLVALEAVRPMCVACLVFPACHAWALVAETEGIWAATTPRMRRQLRRARRIPTPTPTYADDLIEAFTESTAS